MSRGGIDLNMGIPGAGGYDDLPINVNEWVGTPWVDVNGRTTAGVLFDRYHRANVVDGWYPQEDTLLGGFTTSTTYDISRLDYSSLRMWPPRINLNWNQYGYPAHVDHNWNDDTYIRQIPSMRERLQYAALGVAGGVVGLDAVRRAIGLDAVLPRPQDLMDTVRTKFYQTEGSLSKELKQKGSVNERPDTRKAQTIQSTVQSGFADPVQQTAYDARQQSNAFWGTLYGEQSTSTAEGSGYPA